MQDCAPYVLGWPDVVLLLGFSTLFIIAMGMILYFAKKL